MPGNRISAVAVSCGSKAHYDVEVLQGLSADGVGETKRVNVISLPRSLPRPKRHRLPGTFATTASASN